MAHSMGNTIQTFEPTVVAECNDTTPSHHGPHNSGNGRACTYGVDSENYSTSAPSGEVMLEQAVTISSGSVRQAQSQ